MSGQRQQAGDESTNVQIGRDLVYQGPSAEEVREIALDVFRNNFVELGQVAGDIARGRAERLTDEFLAELEKRMPAGLRSASDPDMQRALFDAQSEYACSGEDDLQQALVDLLVDRAGENRRGTRTVVLNEAVRSAPKLTAAQRRAIALCFTTKYTSWHGPLDLGSFYAHVDRDILPLADGVPMHQSEYQHIEYVGAGAIGVAPTLLGQVLIAQGPGYFMRGFTREAWPQLGDLYDDPRVIGPAVRDDSRFQVLAVHAHEIPHLAASAGVDDKVPHLETAFMNGQMQPQDVENELLSRLPRASQLLDRWNHTALKFLTLTSVGLAIGHGYWRRVTGDLSPLSIWIPD